MGGNVVCIAAVLLGIDAYWSPLPGGGVEYIIRIEPHLLDRIASGEVEAIQSDVPPYVKDVRAYRISAGTEQSAKRTPAAEVGSPVRTGVATDWISLPESGVECLILIEPRAFDELKQPGRTIRGVIPPHVKDVRGFKVAAGTKQSLPESPKATVAEAARPAEAAVEKAPPDPPAFQPNPSAFQPDPKGRPLRAQRAVHVEPVGAKRKPPATSPAGQPARQEERAEPSKPWLPLTLALIGLFASLGANVFLLWMAGGFRKRYRALVERMGDAAAQ